MARIACSALLLLLHAHCLCLATFLPAHLHFCTFLHARRTNAHAARACAAACRNARTHAAAPRLHCAHAAPPRAVFTQRAFCAFYCARALCARAHAACDARLPARTRAHADTCHAVAIALCLPAARTLRRQIRPDQEDGSVLESDDDRMDVAFSRRRARCAWVFATCHHRHPTYLLPAAAATIAYRFLALPCLATHAFALHAALRCLCVCLPYLTLPLPLPLPALPTPFCARIIFLCLPSSCLVFLYLCWVGSIIVFPTVLTFCLTFTIHTAPTLVPSVYLCIAFCLPLLYPLYLDSATLPLPWFVDLVGWDWMG